MDGFETVMKRKARKIHKCNLCGRNIEQGETYIQHTGKWFGEFYSDSYHFVCWSILETYWASDYFDQGEWCSSDVREWLEEEYCRKCLGPDADLAECEVPVFRCGKIVEKMMGKEARNG